MCEHISCLTHVSFFCNTPRLFQDMLGFYTSTMGFAPQFTLEFDQDVIESYRQSGYTVTAVPGEVWIAYLKVAERQFVELFNLGGRFGGEQSFKHVCYEVEDLAPAARELTEKGVPVWDKPGPKRRAYRLETPIKPDLRGCSVCFAQDPAGNYIELMQQGGETR